MKTSKVALTQSEYTITLSKTWWVVKLRETFLFLEKCIVKTHNLMCEASSLLCHYLIDFYFGHKRTNNMKM